MKNKSSVPMWATRIAVDVCAAAHRPVPRIVWRHARKSSGGTGHCYWDHISLTVNRTAPRRSTKTLLLHELAHWTVGYGHWHDDVWGQKMFDLCREYHLPTRYGSADYQSVRRAARRARAMSVNAGPVKGIEPS